MSSLQCLFCQHINPADVDYCNRCDGQLNLQPCYRCGGVDLRTASKCHKCGGEFSPPAIPVPDFQFTPSNFDAIDGTPANAETPKSETAQLNADLAHSPLDRPSVDAAILPKNPDPAAKPQRGTRFAVLGLLLLLLMAALAAYVYRDRPQGQEQAANELPAPRNAGESAPDAASTPIDTAHAPPSSANQAAQPQAAPATAANADTSQDPPTGKTCPPAVAALGLCNPDTPQEKP